MKPSSNILARAVNKFFIIAISVLWFAPFYIALIYAFKTRPEIVASVLALPKRLYLGNFIAVITKNPAFISGLRNSVIATIPTVAILTFICPMCAFALARNAKNRWYNLIYVLIISAILIPWQGIMYPVYVDFRMVGLTNTLFGYVVARVGYQVPICILMLTGFVKEIPTDLEEAAHIDGANTFTAFWKIVFPVMKPVNITVLVLNLVFAWNDFNVALTMLPKNATRTLPLAQFYYFGENNIEINLAFAFFILSMLPIVLVYLFCQKYIVSGIVSGAVKG